MLIGAFEDEHMLGVNMLVEENLALCVCAKWLFLNDNWEKVLAD